MPNYYSNLKIRLLTTILAILSIFHHGYAQQPPMEKSVLEKGVSLKLAQQRSKALQNIRYQLHFHIPADVKAPVTGEEIIYFNCLDNTQALQIDFKGEASQIAGIRVNGWAVPIRFENEHLVIARSYLHRGPDSVQVRFTAGSRPMNRNSDFVYTLLVPDNARVLFPCFDQPDLKAQFSLSLTLPIEWSALANANIKDSSIQTTEKTYLFLPSDKISTYLFAFAAGRFVQATNSTNADSMGKYADSMRKNPVNSDARIMHAFYRETDSTKIRLSLDSIFRIHSQALDFLQSYTDILYPFSKFDFVAIPDFQFGGMEHPGAIEYQQSTLFLDESATAEQYNSRSNLLSHETSHMWFGDLVTMRWFNDVWMKEVFANFMADKIGNITRPGGDFQLKFLTSHFPAAYNTDRTAGANPIRQTLENLQDAGSLYGNIIYNKAPIVMQQLERLMGEIPLRDGLREYLKKYAYGNATWPDLIQILGKYTTADLKAWNEVWVNETGRPEIKYICQTDQDTIRQLTLLQSGEDGSKRIWQQLVELALVYPDHTEEFTINMNTERVRVPEVSGKPSPLYILFNSSGKGYGIFPIDPKAVTPIANLSDPVMRASAYINQYENMLNGQIITPRKLLQVDQQYLAKENKELNLGVLLGQINAIFWRFTTPADRQVMAPALENNLWEALQQAKSPNEKKLLFLAYAGIAMTRSAQDTLYAVWNNKRPPVGVKLSEDEYTSLAAGLALRTYPGFQQILLQQSGRIQNPDRRARFQYLQPALSDTQAIRDQFFMTLKDPKNREKEAWVLAALGYLHHPLRAGASEKYLRLSLDWLEEIQQTGDVFFPERWLQASFGNYQTSSAAAVVRRFLKEHRAYNPKLKEKILQNADNLFRAEKLMIPSIID